MAPAKSPPDLHIPQSKHTVTVSVIDTTAHVALPASIMMEPSVPGYDTLAACCYAFLIKHENPDAKGKYDTMLFDLGVRKDFENAPKGVVDMMSSPGTKLEIEKNVIDILKDNGEDPTRVGGIIWSHWHFVSVSTNSVQEVSSLLRLNRTIPAPQKPFHLQLT